MLQQTQVATVIDYYNRWMEKWPTLQELAKATLEDVNTMWSGLGYYSRGRRLLEGVKKVVEELNGKMPATAEDLVKALPGVGRYTAGAIASIAFNQTTGLVDGNVVRVLCRMRMVGADCTSQPVQDMLWSHANKLVDQERPGDFNQSLMELGATVCTPKTPSCSECPVKVEYEKKAAVSKWTKAKVTDEDNNIPDIECAEESCKLCIPSTEEWDPSDGVMNYPRKPKKKPPREETTSVCLVCCHHQEKSKRKFLLLKRKEQGLLAGLWEFPSLKQEGAKKEEAEVWLQTNYSLCLPADTQIEHVGQVVHHFSHITQTYVVDCLVLSEDMELDVGGDNWEWKWMTGREFLTSAISTAMKKVFNAFEKGADKIPVKVMIE
ncbi:adenine DNA glycosylase-like [Liolophura sinensis]|uniref:adenine DNA glycosylase-like n=1 Tax=Liolophura sinensis TaxID=3198878 RepID=UPI0031580E29